MKVSPAKISLPRLCWLHIEIKPTIGTRSLGQDTRPDRAERLSLLAGPFRPVSRAKYVEENRHEATFRVLGYKRS
jgi:hypothetical protein